MNKPFILFGGTAQPNTSMAGYIGRHGSIDEARAQFETVKPLWAQIVKIADDELEVVWSFPVVEEKKSTVTNRKTESQRNEN